MLSVSTTNKMEGEIESRVKEKFKASCPKRTSLCWPRRQPVLSGLVSGYTILCVIAMIGTVECEELSVVDSNIKTMFDLCEKGDLERLKPLVEVYRNPPYPNGNCDNRDRCNTLLHLAAEKGHLRIVQLMVPLLDDNNPKGYNEVTPLHKAAEKGHLEIVQFMVPLLDEKNPRGGWGVTPLHIAAEKGYLEIVQFMVPLLDDKNPRSARSRSSYPSGGVTPLHKAAKEGHLEIIQFLTPLLRWKNPEDNCNGTPLSYAAENNHLNVVMYLRVSALFVPCRFVPADSCRPIHARPICALTNSCHTLFMPICADSCPALFVPGPIHARETNNF